MDYAKSTSTSKSRFKSKSKSKPKLKLKQNPTYSLDEFCAEVYDNKTRKTKPTTKPKRINKNETKK
jgi:hypothetical protein